MHGKVYHRNASKWKAVNPQQKLSQIVLDGKRAWGMSADGKVFVRPGLDVGLPPYAGSWGITEWEGYSQPNTEIRGSFTRHCASCFARPHVMNFSCLPFHAAGSSGDTGHICMAKAKGK